MWRIGANAPIRKDADVPRAIGRRKTMQDGNGEALTIAPSKGERPAKALDNSSWDTIDWKEAEKQTNRLQRKISKAMCGGRINRVKQLQHLLTLSFYARAIAVRTVSQDNKGKHTPGVDGIVWATPKAKYNAVLELNKGRYRAKPLRRIYIPKKSGKLRPLSIPTMYDRAMQALYALALDPVQEATADRNSYGFRIGRCCQDACEEIFKCTSRKGQNPWVLDADIRGCFDNISHQWLLDNIVMDKQILRQFLKAGYVYGRKLFPTDSGTPQGGVASPVLANMTLNGMETLVKKEVSKKACLTRYADDLVVTAPTKELVEKARETLVPFLKERGLEFSEEKTRIVHITEGLDFLGWTFRKTKGKMIIRPSKATMKAMRGKLHKMILDIGVPMKQDDLIWALNPVIRGWGNYHRTTCAKTDFHDIDHYVVECLIRWTAKRHPMKGKKWRFKRYWRKIGKRKWTFATDKYMLFVLSDMPIKRHIKVKAAENPYLNPQYFERRKHNTMRSCKNQMATQMTGCRGLSGLRGNAHGHVQRRGRRGNSSSLFNSQFVPQLL